MFTKYIDNTNPRQQHTIVVIICEDIMCCLILKWKIQVKRASFLKGERHVHCLLSAALNILEGQEFLALC